MNTKSIYEPFPNLPNHNVLIEENMKSLQGYQIL